jgi:diguanylate cyclase
MASLFTDALARLPGAQWGGVWLVVAALLMLALAVVGTLLWRVARSRRQLQERLFSANTRLAEMRNRDGLTGLMARPEFEAALEPMLREADRRHEGLAVLVLGLDNFRAVNEAYGLRVGDALLKQVAQRLARSVGPQVPLARVAGDEFALTIGGDPARATACAVRLLA